MGMAKRAFERWLEENRDPDEDDGPDDDDPDATPLAPPECFYYEITPAGASGPHPESEGESR
jgi:hypothetical protein